MTDYKYADAMNPDDFKKLRPYLDAILKVCRVDNTAIRQLWSNYIPLYDINQELDDQCYAVYGHLEGYNNPSHPIYIYHGAAYGSSFYSGLRLFFPSFIADEDEDAYHLGGLSVEIGANPKYGQGLGEAFDGRPVLIRCTLDEKLQMSFDLPYKPRKKNPPVHEWMCSTPPELNIALGCLFRLKFAKSLMFQDNRTGE